MFLEKVQKKNGNIFQYIIFAFSFLGFMALNIFYSSAQSSALVIKEQVNKLGELLTFANMLLPFLFLMLFLLFWVKFIHKQTIRSLITSRNKIDFKRIFYSFSVWAILLVIITFGSYFSDVENYTFQFNFLKFFGLFVLSVLLIPIQTTFEELFFRGYFMQGVYKVFGKRSVSLILSSVIFGFMHLGNPEVEVLGWQIMLMYIGSGFFLGILTLLDEGLELAIGYHAANNLIGCLLLTSSESVFQTPSLFRYNGITNVSEIYIQLFIIFPFLFVIFSKKFGFKFRLKKII